MAEEAACSAETQEVSPVSLGVWFQTPEQGTEVHIKTDLWELSPSPLD